MRKFVIQFILTLLLAFVFESFLPWWTVAIAGALGAFLVGAPYHFLCGFLAVALLWLAKAFIIDLQAAQSLAEQVATLLMLKHKWMLYALTGLLGGLAGGLGAWSGTHVTRIVLPSSSK